MTAPVHNPFEGLPARGGRSSTPTFDAARLTASGLTDEQVAALREQYDGETPAGKASFARHTSQATDTDLRELGLSAHRASYDPSAKTVAAVLADVEADPELARVALEAEQAGKARVTLTASLAEHAQAAEPQVQGETGTAAVEAEPAPLANPENLTPAVQADTGEVVDDVPPSDALQTAPDAAAAPPAQ